MGERIILVMFGLALIGIPQAFTQDAPGKIVGTKIISLRGAQSYFLDGDKLAKNKQRYTGTNALPLLLRSGWQITSVHLATGELSAGKSIVGYAILRQAPPETSKQPAAKKQKLVYLRANASVILSGDHVDGYTSEEKNALPTLLSTGWAINAIHLAKNLASSRRFTEGYVLVSK